MSLSEKYGGDAGSRQNKANTRLNSLLEGGNEVGSDANVGEEDGRPPIGIRLLRPVLKPDCRLPRRDDADEEEDEDDEIDRV